MPFNDQVQVSRAQPCKPHCHIEIECEKLKQTPVKHDMCVHTRHNWIMVLVPGPSYEEVTVRWNQRSGICRNTSVSAVVTQRQGLLHAATGGSPCCPDGHCVSYTCSVTIRQNSGLCTHIRHDKQDRLYASLQLSPPWQSDFCWL